MPMKEFTLALTDKITKSLFDAQKATLYTKIGSGNQHFYTSSVLLILSLMLRGCAVPSTWDILELSGYNAMCSRTTLLEQRGWATWPAVVPSKGLILWFCDTGSVPAPDDSLPKIFLCISLILNMLLQCEWQGAENFMKEAYFEWWFCLESHEWMY